MNTMWLLVVTFWTQPSEASADFWKDLGKIRIDKVVQEVEKTSPMKVVKVLQSKQTQQVLTTIGSDAEVVEADTEAAAEFLTDKHVQEAADTLIKNEPKIEKIEEVLAHSDVKKIEKVMEKINADNVDKILSAAELVEWWTSHFHQVATGLLVCALALTCLCCRLRHKKLRSPALLAHSAQSSEMSSLGPGQDHSNDVAESGLQRYLAV